VRAAQLPVSGSSYLASRRPTPSRRPHQRALCRESEARSGHRAFR